MSQEEHRQLRDEELESVVGGVGYVCPENVEEA